MTIDCVARLAVDASGHNASDRMNENTPYRPMLSRVSNSLLAISIILPEAW